jgi:serine/threonine protein phosphatase 1
MRDRRYVIPDIHGCALTFRRLLENIIHLKKSDDLYLLGDTIDRGPRSREVLDIIHQLKENGYRVQSIRGNHEEMFLNACSNRSFFRLWMLNGGRATLSSFGVEDACEIPSGYRNLMASFPFFIELDKFILVHGGLNFTKSDPLSDKEAMLWSRDKEVVKELIGGRRLIGGHTPLSREDIKASLTSDRIILDNGCVYQHESGLGSLAALELTTMTLYFQKNIDM